MSILVLNAVPSDFERLDFGRSIVLICDVRMLTKIRSTSTLSKIQKSEAREQGSATDDQCLAAMSSLAIHALNHAHNTGLQKKPSKRRSTNKPTATHRPNKA
jgi:hypothetical protein